MHALSADEFEAIDAALDAVLDALPEARAAILDAHPPAVRAAVERMLALEAVGNPLLDDGWASRIDPASVDGLEDAPPPARLGPFRLGEPLGRGGMGTVYAARRADGAFDADVAVKVLRRGLDTEDIVGRFVRERQLLASLDHPTITRLLDGGTTPDGRPWFAMERVDGRPLDLWARTERPSLRARVALFAQVCEAVHFAHQRLVVHRDLKPAHVLVDAEGTPRLLDFGLAKLLDEPEEAATQTVDRWATPAWAAPEQLEGGATTTATDVWALGGLLHVLLTLSRPAADPTTQQRPSRSVDTPEDLPYPASALRGDLDAIVRQARAPRAADRYPSAGALGEDLRRWLAGEAVSARELSWATRTARWVRHHRGATAFGVAVIALLAGWSLTATLQGQRLAAERDRANLAADQARNAADDARRAGERATRTAAFLESLLTAADPRVAQGEELTAREVLLAADPTALSAPTLGDDPLLVGELGLIVGRSLIAIDQRADALPVLERTRASLVDAEADPTVLAEVDIELGIALTAAGERDRALATLERAMSALTPAGAEHASLRAKAAGALTSLYLDDFRDFDRALEFARESVAARRTIETSSAALARSINALAYVHLRRGELDAAAPLLDEALAMAEATQGPSHPDVAEVLHHMALHERDPAKRAVHRERQLAIYDAAYPMPTYNLAAALNDLGLSIEASDPAGSRTALRKAVAVIAAIAPPESVKRLRVETNLGAVLRDQGRLDEAAPILEAVHAQHLANGGGDRIAFSANHLGQLRALQGRHEEALALYLESLAAFAATDQLGTIFELLLRERIAEAQHALGQPDAALNSLRAAVALHEAVAPPAPVASRQTARLAEWEADARTRASSR